MVMTLRRHNPAHLGLKIVWYLWLMIGTNRSVMFLVGEYESKGSMGKGLWFVLFSFCFGGQTTDWFQACACSLSLCVVTQAARIFSDWSNFQIPETQVSSVWLSEAKFKWMMERCDSVWSWGEADAELWLILGSHCMIFTVIYMINSSYINNVKSVEN